MRGGRDLVVGVRWDADTGGGQLIVVDVAEDSGFLLLGVQP